VITSEFIGLGGAPYDPELAPGARNAVENCLGVRAGERLTLIVDRATSEIGASLWAAAQRAGAEVQGFMLEVEGTRPLMACPPTILEAIDDSAAVIGCFQPQEGEIPSRVQMIDLIERKRIRYAHMVWISSEIMCQAMRADYRAIDALSRWVLDTVRGCARIMVKSPAGTDIEATFNPDYVWIKTSGIVDPAYWSNLPGGEVWTAPENINGVFVVDGAVGDYLCPKYGDISATPLSIEVENGLLRDAHCANTALLADFVEYCARVANGNRVGEFALGTNIGISRMIGNLLQDEKVPGVHIAFGNPCASLTGTPWTCTTHIDAISRNTDVWADGAQIMAGGQYLI
jgi:leucyl aminopeptidase (aminopeptidase T)